jgi:hypothetical protein
MHWCFRSAGSTCVLMFFSGELSAGTAIASVHLPSPARAIAVGRVPTQEVGGYGRSAMQQSPDVN